MSEYIGTAFRTQIPVLGDDADIREAFKLYHYGSVNGDTGGVAGESIAGYLQALTTNVNGKISSSVIDSKGDILVGTADNTITKLAIVNTNGLEYVLAIDNTSATGLKWVMSGKDEERISNIMGVY